MTKQELINLISGKETTEKQRISEVERDSKTRKIIVPDEMSLIDASQELMRQYKELEQKVDFDRYYSLYEWRDFLVAVKKATERQFGWIRGKTKAGGFFSPEQPPTFIDVKTNIIDGKPVYEKSYYGQIVVTPWDNAIMNISPGNNNYISVYCKKKYQSQVSEFFDTVEHILKTESIYTGKAVAVTFNNEWDALEFNIIENTPNHIILNSDTDQVVKHFIINNLEKKDKRVYLFTGDYGTAKTETACRIGVEANKKGITFYYLKDSQYLPNLIKLATNYEASLIFMEDVDEITSGSQRNSGINQILNTLDGVESKGKPLTVIFTTNHEEKINAALRRPGRIDLIVKFVNPTPDKAVEIIQYYTKGYSGFSQINWESVKESLPDAQGAVIAEIGKRSSQLAEQYGYINNELIETSVNSILPQLELMNGRVEEEDDFVKLAKMIDRLLEVGA